MIACFGVLPDTAAAKLPLADVAEYVRDQQQGVPAERLSEGEQVPRD